MARICSLCQKPVEPGSAVYGYNGNHWDCEQQGRVQAKQASASQALFVGRTYQQKGGYKNNAIRFADKDAAVATTAYSFGMSDDEKHAMARRITAALNLTRNLTVETMEASAPLVTK
ncbi:MAG: hypothetical protein BGO63_03875 [Candidatus Accumulibacter sp. 66-26]|nr:MAG: hypothetical protein BGO63_03875 [Candidatus Accumulibacter sp. 66-26]